MTTDCHHDITGRMSEKDELMMSNPHGSPSRRPRATSFENSHPDKPKTAPSTPDGAKEVLKPIKMPRPFAL
eukprot:CAMPEP_0195262964 /NCGR_PEP_ID=MMETSP0706-20130129/10046_1 /TAXON_ID=33640 /ORGANISM="Asterionellopsis glacialis, Strain CCMP134" /LENGTH=70 /DNA_ID=CAMNT_0040317101 /DNA_START=73 /DNA_END=285 /DNA_ORIENTATION=+